MRRFEGKGVIVTGAGRGIGQATAQRFASEGADVMLIGRTLLPLEETAELVHSEGGKAWPHACDV
ncbi:MAG: meso-butanediol dehydrogenase / (S,S)-butanediol dehydrogenase / diacetyl reductase, partial [Gaiellales bacterium]|nr:meso-butanediol dehydrogenase / (S,S)-butanediol dehydrogenase / diacetyl reductase [Gaiellales bacterium]